MNLIPGNPGHNGELQGHKVSAICSSKKLMLKIMRVFIKNYTVVNQLGGFPPPEI